MATRGSIERNERGYVIRPGVWPEALAAPSPQSRLTAGRLVRVTFDFILAEDGTRAEIEERVEEALNMEFELASEPLLQDLGLRTDKLELTEQALSAYRPTLTTPPEGEP